MIGPLGSRPLQLFENADWTGRMVTFQIPAGNFLGSFTTIHESWDTDSVKLGPFTGPNSSGIPVTPPFGNLATSSTWA